MAHETSYTRHSAPTRLELRRWRRCFRVDLFGPVPHPGVAPARAPRGRKGAGVVVALAVTTLAMVAAGCSSSSKASPGGSGSASGSVINAIGAENEYADVMGQIGGQYVHVSSILNNPNTDPHTFESSPSVAKEVSAAELIVQNGVGYDDFMAKIESASPNARRKVIDVQHLLGLPDSTPNPHLWYDPKTMPAVAAAVAAALSALQPANAAYFQANVQKFDTSLTPWLNAIAAFKAQYAGYSRGDHRTRGRLSPGGDGHEQPDPVRVPGRHHERYRPDPAGHLVGERILHQAPGEGVLLQPAGRR